MSTLAYSMSAARNYSASFHAGTNRTGYLLGEIVSIYRITQIDITEIAWLH